MSTSSDTLTAFQKAFAKAKKYPHISFQHGDYWVTGTSVPVRRLWHFHVRGGTADTLFKRYPALGPAKILTALAFAYDNQDFMREADGGVT